ncbi:hypothetical protein ABID22_002031 [Pontibacter aydingkolensis]|uniref:SpoIIAA-like n=1 Tax=Pontibacter aydingkolensis TaxID=1911536 RepID=A0ABS7CV15_9BACT|nr:hypothetical protein [Pontibacter aydingkolensis]MBW7467647.1 hypothetical protein [Pontibacter aydingkolensis]
MVEIEKDYLRGWVDRSIMLMYSEWLRPVNSIEYREGSQQLLYLLQQYEVLNWISDSEKLGDITVVDEQWTLMHIVPAMTQTTLLKVARVSGEDKSSYSKFENFVIRAEEIHIGNIMVRQFVTYKEAADWIGEIPV